MRSIIRKLFIAFVIVCQFFVQLEPFYVIADNSIGISALGTPYLQDFNTLSNNGESDTFPFGWVLSETETSNNVNNKYQISTGSYSTGDTYSYGSINETDRALGGLQDPSFVPLYGASFTNHTGGVIQSLSIKYTGEEWRLGKSGRSDKLIFEISLDATSLNNGTWHSYDDLIFFTPNKDTEGAKNGNHPTNKLDKSYTISGLNIAPGGSFWIRWRDHPVTNGINDGLAVDDFSLIPYGIDNPPAIMSITPDNNAINVALDANLAISFSEPVDLLVGWLTLSCSKSNQHSIAVSGGPQSFSIDPTIDFVFGDQCTVTVKAEKVVDQDATDPPDVINKDYSFNFSTILPPDAAPIITNISPANDAVEIPLDSSLSINFSEPVLVSPGWFSINCSTSGTHPAEVVSGSTTFVLTPDEPFENEETCTLSVQAADIHDLDSDDPPDSMPSDFTISFSTLTTPDSAPYLLSSLPANGAEMVDVN
ncbi:MAG: hypothetical protein CVU42_04010 [Chloroflexi bacterium HGW-Chloroflexi-4]|jgi:hypothetical protein|nr:MAG: hypothetical protein CVU42_04010 [Chloroflexi bacterium HGW-Chloroflexi-4]